MFVTENDYKTVTGDGALSTLSQTSEENRSNAELEAVEEISSYLRPKYDVKAIFGATGEARNRLIVMYVCDIALYHMSASMPQRLGAEIRRERYDAAIRKLEGIQSGKIVPDLPAATESEADPSTLYNFVYSSQTPLGHNW